jgi:capsular polysaccharide biosynthesis protein
MEKNTKQFNMHEALSVILRWGWLVILTTVVGYFSMKTYTDKHTVFTYETKTQLILTKSEDNNILTSVADLLQTESYTAAVNKELTDGLAISTGAVSFGHSEGSEIFSLTMTGTDKEHMAKELNTSTDVLMTMMKKYWPGTKVSVVSKAETPTSPTGPDTSASKKIGAIIGIGVGLLISIVLELLRRERNEMKEKEVKTEEA